MPDELLSRSFEVRGRDFEKAGEASTEIKSLLKALEIDPDVIRRTVVIAFEAEMNVVMYADEGTVSFVVTDEDIGIEVADRGPGDPRPRSGPPGGLVDRHRRDARDGLRLRHGAAEHPPELGQLRGRVAGGRRDGHLLADQPRRTA